MGFRDWIEEYWNTNCHEAVGLDAITYFLNWLKNKKIDEDSDQKDLYLNLLDKFKANRTVRMCFESAWREYGFAADKVGVVEKLPGEDIADERVEPVVEPIVMHIRKVLKGPHEEGGRDIRETIAVRKFLTEPARIGLKLGLTRDQGGFESARVDVSLTLPCYAEEIPDASKLIEKFVSVKLLNQFKALEGRFDEQEEEPLLFEGEDDDIDIPF